MTDTQSFLLELHCEEIPARFLKPLSEEFSGFFQKFAQEQALDCSAIQLRYSPRKLSWRVEALPLRQPDQTETQVGPPQRMCLDDQGQPTVQGLKFAEKWGLGFEQIQFGQPAGKKEPCALAILTRKGRPTRELLSEHLPRLIGNLHVPKAMRWGNSEFEFVRPIRSILALLGPEVVPFSVDGVASGKTTWGHRLYHRQHAAPVEISTPESYEAELESAGIVVDFAQRRQRLQVELNFLAKEAGGRVVEDEELLDTLAEIVEVPKALRGDFPEHFLNLPKEVLVTSLKEHQKSFCIENEQGELLPHFLTAANRPDDPEGYLKSGNEWVLRARLYDARFFHEEDLRTPLEQRFEKLSHLTFQRELGSYAHKALRMESLAQELASSLGLDPEEARQAARLAKCDLVTLMVGEFPELQGVMGGEYLRKEGAPEVIWKAVKEHYQPISAEAPIPETPLGCLISLCDKLDTVVGCFALGLIPSGSKDPLALRRAGMGLIRMIWEQGWNLDPMELCEKALERVQDKAKQSRDESLKALESFFRDRVAYQLELALYPGTVRRSALASGWRQLPDLKARCEALKAFAGDERFASLAQSAKRIGNILKDDSPTESFEAKLLQDPSEIQLAEKLQQLRNFQRYEDLLLELAALAQPLAAFFDAVMVKCEDPALRAARLSLLHGLRILFQRVADFSLWQ